MGTTFVEKITFIIFIIYLCVDFKGFHARVLDVALIKITVVPNNNHTLFSLEREFRCLNTGSRPGRSEHHKYVRFGAKATLWAGHHHTTILPRRKHTWSLSSQSQRNCNTYFPGVRSAGICTASTTSRFGRSGPPLECPEHLHTPALPPEAPCVAAYRMQAADSLHTGSNEGPSRSQSTDGMGFLRHIDPGGVVPSTVCHPLAAVSNSSCEVLLPSHLSPSTTAAKNQANNSQLFSTSQATTPSLNVK